MSTHSSNGTSIKVFIVEDHKVFRDGLKHALSQYRDIRLIAEASHSAQLLNALKTLVEVDVILLDIILPDKNGTETLLDIKQHYPNIKVVMLSMHTDPKLISQVMSNGANAYLSKSADPEEIYTAIKTVHEEGNYFNDLVNKAMLTRLRNKPVEVEIGEELTEKEKKILRFMCEEKSTKEIADLVELSPRTVEALRDKLKTKTGAKSMAGLIMFAVKSKIYSEEPLEK